MWKCTDCDMFYAKFRYSYINKTWNKTKMTNETHHNVSQNFYLRKLHKVPELEVYDPLRPIILNPITHWWIAEMHMIKIHGVAFAFILDLSAIEKQWRTTSIKWRNSIWKEMVNNWLSQALGFKVDWQDCFSSINVVSDTEATNWRPINCLCTQVANAIQD